MMKKQLADGGLGRRIVFLMIVASALLSILASAVQLQLGFQRDRAIVLEKFQLVESNFRLGFESALWNFDTQQVEILMDGVIADPDIETVELQSSTGQRWAKHKHSSDKKDKSSGNTPDASTELSPKPELPDSDKDLLVKSIQLHHKKSASEEPIGVLTIGLTLEVVKARMWAQLFTLLLSNFVKTSLASLTMMIIFNQLVSRHLRDIAAHVTDSDWLERPNMLSLARVKKRSKKDEFDNIVDALNTAQTKNLAAIKELKSEIDERKSAQTRLAQSAANLEQANTKLQRTNQEQAEFSYSISHDLKSPVNTISMLLNELALSHREEFGDEAAELLDLSQKTAKRMGTMVEDVLDYSLAIEANQTFEPVQLTPILEGLISDLSADINSADAKIRIEPLPTVYGNPTSLRILFQNLLSNAIKFRARDRQPLIDIKAIPNETAGYETIILQDNGIGIDPAFHKEIFGLFQRLHSREEYPGTGLGLTLCKRIVTDQEGTIVLSSELDKGTTFEISLRSTTT